MSNYICLTCNSPHDGSFASGIYCSIKCSSFRQASAYTTKYTDAEVFVENSTYPRKNIKKRILEKNLLEYKCACCGLGGYWNDMPLVLQLDHINGVNNDHRLTNLRFLCPNCHTQQDTYAGKNRKK